MFILGKDVDLDHRNLLKINAAQRAVDGSGLVHVEHCPQDEDGQPQPPLASQPLEHSKQELQHGILSFLGVKSKKPAPDSAN